jgi:peptidase E
MSHRLLISNSTLHGRGYLDHAEEEIRRALPGVRTVLFVPYALRSSWRPPPSATCTTRSTPDG